jgi:hypothetical protein
MLARFGQGALLTGLLLLVGCSSFNREWQQNSFSAPTEDIQGRWQGTWASEATGHTDKLRCIISKKTDGTFQAWFHAKYKKVLSFGYTVPLKVELVDRAWKFQGEADLGWLAGGVYHYKGSAGGTNFTLTYESKYDHGTFEMNRADPGIDAGRR